MNKAQKRFVRLAVLAIAVLLAVLLGVINAINFTMAAQDADRVTQRIAESKGAFGAPEFIKDNGKSGGFRGGGMGPMGPDSPEMNASMRFFTCSFETEDGKVESFNISAISEDEALEWARSLLGGQKQGWTRWTYRYRVYKTKGVSYVAVIDYGRELLTAYRILLFSVVGAAVGVLLSWLVLRFAGKKLFRPVEEADNKQKQFIASAEKEFKLPLTVIEAETEIIERESGPDERTRSIHRQVRKMNALVRNLGSLAIYDDAQEKTEFSLSELLTEKLDAAEERFEARGLVVERAIAPEVKLTGSREALERAVAELIDNAVKYAARGPVRFALEKENARVRLTVSNGADLPDGAADQVFDRFTTLSNAKDGSAGLGLAFVKDVVRAHAGRASAKVADGRFTVELDL